MLRQQVGQVVEIHAYIGKHGLQIKIVTADETIQIRIIAILNVEHLIVIR